MWFHFINAVDKEELLFLLLGGSGESSESVVEKSIFQAEVFAGHSSRIREIEFEENIGLPQGNLIAYLFEVLRWLLFWVNIQAEIFICRYRTSPLLLILQVFELMDFFPSFRNKGHLYFTNGFKYVPTAIRSY